MTADVNKLEQEKQPAEVDQVSPSTAEPGRHQRVLEHIEGRGGGNVVMQVEHQQGAPDVSRQDGGTDDGQGGLLDHSPTLVGSD